MGYGIALIGQHDRDAAVVRTPSAIRGWGKVLFVTVIRGDHGIGGVVASPGRRLVNPISKEVSFCSASSSSSFFFYPPMPYIDVF